MALDFIIHPASVFVNIGRATCSISIGAAVAAYAAASSSGGGVQGGIGVFQELMDHGM